MMTAGHMWVAIQYTPIEVELQPDGSIHTFTSELADEIARDDSKIGCWNCGAPLNTDTYDTECVSQIILAGDLDTDAGS